MKAVIFAYHDMDVRACRPYWMPGRARLPRFLPCRQPENTFWLRLRLAAAELGIPVYAPDNVTILFVDRIAELAPDIIFSFYYRATCCEEILHLASAARSICTVLIACLSWPCAAKLGSG